MGYGYTLEQVASRALADCNRDRLNEHRDCDYCHLCFDCDYFKKETGETLCTLVDKKDVLDTLKEISFKWNKDE